jgi:hypothetical protein
MHCSCPALLMLHAPCHNSLCFTPFGAGTLHSSTDPPLYSSGLVPASCQHSVLAAVTATSSED